MNRQAINNYTQKLNVLVGSQSCKNLQETSKSTDRNRVQTSGRNTTSNFKVEFQDTNRSQQSFRTSTPYDRADKSTHKQHRMIIESPNSKQISLKENNFYLRRAFNEPKVSQATNNQGSLTSDLTKSSQNGMINRTISSIHTATSNKYEPIKRIFQQVGNTSQVKDISQKNVKYDDMNQLNATTDRSSYSTRDDNMHRIQQLIQNKYTHILQNSQLFKRESQIKQNLPIKFHNAYDINLIDIHDMKSIQYSAASSESVNSQNQSLINSQSNQSNISNETQIKKHISLTQFNQIGQPKSLFQRNIKFNEKLEQQNLNQQQNLSQPLMNIQDTEQNDDELSQNIKTQYNLLNEKDNNAVSPNINNNSHMSHSILQKRLNQSASPIKNVKSIQNQNIKTQEYTDQTRQQQLQQEQQQKQQQIEIWEIKEEEQLQQQQQQQQSQQQQFQKMKVQNSLHSDKDSQWSRIQPQNYTRQRQELEFCLLDIIEKLDKNVMSEIQDKYFDKKYFGKIIDILNEKMPSMLIRINEMLGVDSSLNSFLLYFNNFMNWFFTLAQEHIDKHIKRKAEEECSNYIEQIAQMKKTAFLNINKQMRQDHKIQQLENQVSHLKVLLNDEKNLLQMQVNTLEERIDEITNIEHAQDKHDEMTSKIQEMQLFIKNLQTENRITSQTLEDNLCQLGHSLMVRAKDQLEYQDSIRRQATEIELTSEYIIQRLKVFIKNLRDDQLFEQSVAESFMEYILGVSKTQHEGFQEIEHIIRYLLSIEEKPIAIFFSRLFGILGNQFPSQLAIKEVFELKKDLISMNYNDLDDLIVYDDELQLIISATISNQNVVLNFKNQYQNSPKILKCQILSYFLQAITVQEELEKGDEIYNQITVSSSENILTFETKLSYQKVKQLASQLKVKPFILMNYMIQTYDRYSKERKKEQLQNGSKTVIQLNSNFIPKVMCDCYRNICRFQLMYYVDMQFQNNKLNGVRAYSTHIYTDSIMEEEEELQHLREKQVEKQQPKKKSIDKKKVLLANMKKVKNSIKLINVTSSQKTMNSIKFSGQQSLSQLDLSVSSRKSQQQNTNGKK